nr:endonuclease/exonuclease/phosphatase family protein [Bacteroidota bacterium]
MKAFRLFYRFFGALIGFVVFFLILAVFYATLTDYGPQGSAVLKPAGKSQKEAIDKNTLNLVSWNIGYAGLGKEMDFFYEGGEQVRPLREEHVKYFMGIINFFAAQTDLDFILLQEVDLKARRSYGENQVNRLQGSLPGYESVFAQNYNVKFIPVPINNPMGGVVSGVQNFSRFRALTSERISFPGNFSWPKKLFMLDRCFIIQRFLVAGGKILVVINTHNSAFDDGTLREKQFKMLKQTALEEYQKGNYVIIGGDWNQNPTSFDLSAIQNGDMATVNELGNIAVDFMPEGWRWAYDPAIPTNRDVSTPYSRGVTLTSILDYFLVSPNIEIGEVKAFDLGFENADHNPVRITVKLSE